jgi:hypothetical protein
MAEMLLAEAAAAFGVSVDTIRRRVRRGDLEHHTDNQGRIVVRLDAPAQQIPSNGHTAAATVPSAARQATEHVAEQRLADAEHAARQARLEGLRDQLDAAQSEVAFLRATLGLRDEELRRRDEQHEREREQWHERLHEALAALAMQRALPQPTEATVPAPEPSVPTDKRPWWRRWWRQGDR